MTNEETGRLYNEQEKARATVAELRRQIQAGAELLTRYARDIQIHAEDGTMASGPLAGFSLSKPMHDMGNYWDQIPSKDTLAQMALELRAEVSRLEGIATQLSRR